MLGSVRRRFPLVQSGCRDVDVRQNFRNGRIVVRERRDFGLHDKPRHCVAERADVSPGGSHDRERRCDRNCQWRRRYFTSCIRWFAGIQLRFGWPKTWQSYVNLFPSNGNLYCVMWNSPKDEISDHCEIIWPNRIFRFCIIMPYYKLDDLRAKYQWMHFVI